MSILVGFEIGTGRRIEIPDDGHLAWFGQTQLSGKTTALEAIVYRGHLKAIAFITKQGEGSFLTGRQIQPYFSEPTNDEEQPLWRWVKSILEASQQRRLNFEESWIIRACEDPHRATSLAGVHENIKMLLGGEGGYVSKGRGKKKKQEWKYTRKPVTGMHAGVYTSLKAYFDIVMPQLARLPYTKKLELHPGLNVMNLQEYAMETQALVIRSVMEWVYQHEKNIRVIVPESQDFVPQGKNTPVKMACETLVRKAGANKNFMWLDSQDMAAVDKIMLRACSIVGCGVQRELHEIDRTLASMFSPSLKPVDVAKLKLGEFFICLPQAEVSKVYVMPAWMDSEIHAQAIAKGEESVETTRLMLRKFKDSRNPEDESMWEEKYKALEKDHKELIKHHDALVKEVASLRGRIDSSVAAGETVHHAPEPGHVRTTPGSLSGNGRELPEHLGDAKMEEFYQFIKKRATADPGILELLARRPELHVKVERPVNTFNGTSQEGWIAALIADKFLDTPKDRAAIGNELRRRGRISPTTNLKILSMALSKLTGLGFLTIEEAGYQAVPGMKVEIREAAAAR